MKKDISSLLKRVRCPARYLGNEINSCHKPEGEEDVRMVICYPDIYEVGMSSLGVRIIYGLMNEISGVFCERVFAPAQDMESLLREKELPLFTLESRRPVRDADILGFSLSSGLNYTNMLNLLSLSRISLFSSVRGEEEPIVLAGGSSTLNPAPLEPFVDAFVVGEAEDVMVEIIDAYRGKKGRGRHAVLESLSMIEGVYVPGVGSGPTKRRFVRDLDRSFFPVKWLVPSVEIVHDRISLEIMRGCGHGCLFCQAGSCWRPVRKRTPSCIYELAKKAYALTGYEEISLLSFSSGDHPGIREIMDMLLGEFSEKKVAVSFPSLRIDTFSFELAASIGSLKKTTLTFAPETSQSLRPSIGKNIMDAELFELAAKARRGGWRHLKLYFMLGLPGEDDGVLEDVANFINELSLLIGIRANFNTFVPKPHTPFQYERFISEEEYRHKKSLLVGRVKRSRYIKLSFQSYCMSYLENFLGRGDRDISSVIHRAWSMGGRMENWSESFDFGLWQKSADETGISMDNYLYLPEGAEEPWHMIEV